MTRFTTNLARSHVSFKLGQTATALLPSAAEELRQLLRTGQTTCKSFEIDRYGRSVATCQSGALNLNSEMVRRGWAVAFVQFGVDYVLIEKEARAAKRGLWAGKFEEPATYRKRMRPMQSDATGVNDWQPD